MVQDSAEGNGWIAIPFQRHMPSSWSRNSARNGIGDAYRKMLNNRTLTNLYNGLHYFRLTRNDAETFLQSEFDRLTRNAVSISKNEELDDIHTALDHAVLETYG